MTSNVSWNKIGLRMDYKYIIVTSIHETGSEQPPLYYRFIILTSVIITIQENIITRVIITIKKTSNLLKNEQHGFRNGLSFTINHLAAGAKLTESLENEKSVDIIKVLDNVINNRLLVVLNNREIAELLLKCNKAFMTGHKQ